MSNPLVSVAIITFNQKSYLKECLDSVIEQDYENIEIIVADDASTDGTQEMLRVYAEEFKNIKPVLGDVNLGITSNLNRALYACQGKYIAFLGGDDLMLPGRIQKQVKALEDLPSASSCISSAELFDERLGGVVGFSNPVRKYHKSMFGVQDLIKSCNSLAVASSYMVRRNLCAQTSFDTRLTIAADFLFFVDVATHGPIVAIKEPLTRHRKHSKSITEEGYGFDGELTACLITCKYPKYFREAKIAAAKVYYFKAASCGRAENIQLAKEYLKISWCYKKNIRVLLWTVLLSAPKGLRQCLISVRLFIKNVFRQKYIV